MSYAIYGFRVIGDNECRYVGMTCKSPTVRLEALTRYAHYRASRRYLRDPDTFQRWLIEHADKIEAFEITRIKAKADAHLAERVAVASLLSAGHRLFNSWLVPKERRINECPAWREAA